MPDVVADVSAASPICTSSSPAPSTSPAPAPGSATRSCSVAVLAPVGADTFTATLYDAPSAGGNVLGTGSAQQTVAAATPFQVSIVVAGVPYSLVVSVAPSSFTIGTASSATVSVAAYDYDENLISGTYASPVTLTDSDATGAFALASTTTADSSSTAVLNYSGVGATTARISATESGVQAANVSGQTVTAGPPAQYLYATEQDTSAITVTLASGSGDLAPVRTIAGSATTLDDPVAIAVDTSGAIYTENSSSTFTPQSYEIAVFAPGANQNAAPERLINGADTGLGQSVSIAVDSTGQIFSPNQNTGQVLVYAAGANGDAMPARTITSAGLSSPTGVALDANGLLYVLNGNVGTQTTAQPNALLVFDADSAGSGAVPIRAISGSATGLNNAIAVAVDGAGDAYVSNASANTITVYGPAQNGNVTPLRTISGTNTMLDAPLGISLDATGDLFVTNQRSQNVVVFAPGATGNAAPVRVFSGAQTGFATPYAIDVSR